VALEDLLQALRVKAVYLLSVHQQDGHAARAQALEFPESALIALNVEFLEA
jgi:hypothetical protein